MKKTISFSVEKGFRYLNLGISFFHFFMIQFRIKKKNINNGLYCFSLINDQNEIVFSKEIIINLEKKIITTPNSHEDPLIESDKYYFLCFQINSEIISTLTQELKVVFVCIEPNKKLIYSFIVQPLSHIYEKYKTLHYSFILDDTKIKSVKDCTLTLHLGDINGKYHEENFIFLANTEFNFSQYINNYSYIGVQCSYEQENPEIEEKHIIIGQKGIFLSGYFYENNLKINSIIPFQEKYQQKYDITKFKLIKNIEELIQYYKLNKLVPKYFESTLLFLLPEYKKTITYNQDYLYSNKSPSIKNQFALKVCKNCSKNYKCLQIVPSGLSHELFRRNITLENEKTCSIYQICP